MSPAASNPRGNSRTLEWASSLINCHSPPSAGRWYRRLTLSPPAPTAKRTRPLGSVVKLARGTGASATATRLPVCTSIRSTRGVGIEVSGQASISTWRSSSGSVSSR